MSRLPVQVAVYCVRQNNGKREYLMLHRVFTGMKFWQGVTGGVESEDPDYHTAALRELKEETGFDPESLEMLDYTYTFPVLESMRKLYDSPVDQITEIVFLARIAEGAEPVIDPIEHDQYRWCDFETAMKMLYWEGNKEALRRCEDLF